MDKLQTALNSIIGFCIGMSLASLLITNTENYKIAILVMIAAVLVKLAIYYKDYKDR
jgi:uncharacterized membrane protein YgaE (UPF0421/DUF939 family)